MPNERALAPDQVQLIEDALETARLMFGSLDGLEIRYSEADVRKGHFAREIRLLESALEALKKEAPDHR